MSDTDSTQCAVLEMKGAKSRAPLCREKDGNAAKALLRNILDKRKGHQSLKPV